MQQLPERILCLVTDIERAGDQHRLLEIVDQAVSGAVIMVQIRAHELDYEQMVAFASEVIKVVNNRAVVVLNGSPEVALTTRVDGVHLPEDSKLGRDDVDPKILLGKSVHSLESALNAEAAGADYVILGTIFPSASHPGGKTGGTALVSAVAERLTIPVIGIGGITAENSQEVIAAGADGIAVIGAIIESDNPRQAAKELADSIGLH